VCQDGRIGGSRQTKSLTKVKYLTTRATSFVNEESQHNQVLLSAAGQSVDLKQMLVEGNLDGVSRQR
jgi:hypothetical protein